ncbi:hypothetical protein EBR43_08015 [bacterium]|nr:hypothetical protein [bacterium]
MTWLYVLLGVSLSVSAFLVLFRLIFSEKNENINFYSNDPDYEDTKKFLEAKEVFVRDPSQFSDKDSDGVDDILENK